MTSFLAPVAIIIGSYATLGLFAFLIGYAIAYGATKTVDAKGIIPAVGIAFLALFNPWVYSKLVAGHIVMIASYAACLTLAAAMRSGRPRWAVLWLCAATIGAQIQFGLVVLAIALFMIHSASWRIVLAALVVTLLPSLIGVATNVSDLTAIPYLVAWQHGQSVSPLSAFALNGYFTHYTDKLPGWWSCVAFVFPVLAVVGAIRGRACGERRVVAFFALTLLVVAMGDRGPLGNLYDALVAHVYASGLFRELYDLLGIVAVCYVILAKATLNAPVFARLAFLAGVLIVCGWFVHPPSRFWVNGSERAAAPKHLAPANTRYALFPYRQPLEFEGRGSGSDPDLVYLWSKNISPLNEYSPSYPAVTALAEFEASGSARSALQALSVSRVYIRSKVTSDTSGLREQSVFSQPPATLHSQAVVLRLTARPEMWLTSVPKIVSGIPSISENAIFFGDVYPHAFRRVATSRAGVDAAKTWVDARLAFAAYPGIGQPFGGAFTTSRAGLSLTGPDALVWVRGRLIGSHGNNTLASNTNDYRWIPIGNGQTVRCYGVCAIAATGKVPSGLPLSAPGDAYAAVPFHVITPWLIRANIPPGGSAGLVYNVRYNPHWALLDGHQRYHHVRIAGIANGWIMPKRNADTAVTLIYTVALYQSAAEAASLIIVLLALYRLITTSFKRPFSLKSVS